MQYLAEKQHFFKLHILFFNLKVQQSDNSTGTMPEREREGQKKKSLHVL